MTKLDELICENYNSLSNNSKVATVGSGVPFERTRRITGYLVGHESRWGNAKKKELEDRVKHTIRAKNG